MILVTGGTGFIGKELVPELQRIDDVRVISRSRFDAPYEVMSGDIYDYSFVRKAMKDVDYVFHLAKYKGHNFPYHRHHPITVLGTKNIMTAARIEGVKKVVHMSTAGVGMKNVTPYAKAKAEAEKIVKAEWGQIEAPIVRASLVYDGDVVEKLRKYSFFPFPYKKQKVHLSFKPSVVQALVGAMRYGRSEVYEVGDKEPVLLTDLYKELAKPRPMLFLPPQVIWLLVGLGYPVQAAYNLAGKKPPFTPTFVKYTFEDRVLDIQNAVNTLKYVPVDTLETVRMLKAQRTS
jgi:nucleoside-diphosphate-sugar epimerase